MPTVLLTPDITTISPGQLVNLTISVSATNGDGAGFFIEASVGKFSVTDSGTKLASGGVTHTATRTSTGGAPIIFKTAWTAPSTVGNVDFNVWGNSVNDDGKSSGDGEGSAFYSAAFGCTGTKYYRDFDGDGVGAESSGYTVACTMPMNYALKSGDCNDNDPKIYAGAPEICDGKDNNCNGQIDEGLPIATYCTDADGDGHGVAGKMTMMGCGPTKGFGLCDNDCNDNNPAIYPGAKEICNNIDDNCDGRVDENARAICGVGWCAKYAEGCTSSCTPGQPRAEECNDFDDDCDGVIDNGTDLELCGKPGLTCRGGYCVSSDSVGTGGSSSSSGSSSSTGSGTSMSYGGSTSSTSGAAAAIPGAGSSDVRSNGDPPSGCSLGFASTRAPLSAAGLLLGFGALLRRRRRAQTRR